MKIGIFVSGLNQTAGGAFSISSQILNYLKDHKIDIGHDLVLITEDSVGQTMIENLVTPRFRKRRFLNMFFALSELFKVRWRLNRVDFLKIRSHALSDFFRKADIDVVWSVQPLSIPLSLPYVTTSWDIAHRMSPYFPEFISEENGDWLQREKSIQPTVQRALGVVVGTEVGALELVAAYGISRTQTWVVPFFAPVNTSPEESAPRNQNQLIYPAHFWPHKNHRTLILALAEVVKSTSLRPKLILVGSDKGSMTTIKKLVTSLGLEDYVEFKGFVSHSELVFLYKTSKLMIFPSLLGPDNLPPLEALTYSCPIAIAEVPGAREQLGVCATYFDPLSVESIANQIIEGLNDPSFGTSEIAASTDLLKARTLEGYIYSVLKKIISVEAALANGF